MKKLSIAFVLILFTFLLTNMLWAAYEDEEKINLAVLNLDSRGGLSPSEVGILTDRLRSMLVRTQAFDVVDRGRMSEILNEQGFQMSGCTSTDCAVEAGKILGVEQMVAGSIGRIGKMYTIDISLIDITTSRIIKSLTRDYTGGIEGLVAQMKSIADELAGDKPAPKQVGAYKIDSKPAGATIYINGIQSGVTPQTIENLSPVEHTLKIEKAGYVFIKGKIKIDAGKTKSYTANLVPAFSMVISSTPSAAGVYIDNKLIGNTPFNYPFQKGREIIVEVKKSGHKTWRQNVTMDKNQYFKMDLQSGSGLADTEYKKAEDGGVSTIWWILGGAAVVGGGAAFFLSQSSGDAADDPVTATFPAPPARPQ